MLFEDVTTEWKRALLRGHREGIEVKRTAGSKNSDRQTFLATSYRRGKPAGFVYAVELSIGPHGIDIRCGCDAGSNGRVCDHKALVLEASGFLSADELVEAVR